MEKSASQAPHLFDDLLAEAVHISPSRKMLDVIGESPDDSHLRSKLGEPKFSGKPGIVV